MIEAAFGEIDADHLAGAEAPVLGNALGRDGDHAGLGADDEHAVGGDAVAHGAKPVAVHPGEDPGSVGRGDGRRAVPRLHHAIAEVVEGAVVGRHVLLLGPGVGDQQAVSRRHGAPGPHHAFEHGVERHGIRRVRLDQRKELAVVGAEDVARSARLVIRHPVLVAANRVDLAVVGEHAEGLRQPPRGEGVGRIALVEDREARHEALVEQVRIERRELLGQEHALVDERAARERADVEAGDVTVEHLLLDAPADDVEVDLELVVVDAAPVDDHYLLDLGPSGVRLLPDHRGIDRHLAPAHDAVAEAEDLGLDDAAADVLRAEVGLGQEHHADRQPPAFGALTRRLYMLPEEVLRNLDMDAGAVAGHAVGVDRAPMPHGLECRDARLDHVAPRRAVERGDQPDPTGIVLERGVVEAEALAGLSGMGMVLSLLHAAASLTPSRSSAFA